MLALQFNWAAIVVAGLAFWLFGMIWYAPPMFGRAWSEAGGVRPSTGTILESAVVSVVAAVLLAVVLSWTNAVTWDDGILVGVIVWAASAGTAAVWGTLFERTRSTFITINAGYQFVGFAMMGVILGAWR